MAVANSLRLYRIFHQTYDVCTVLDTAGGGTEWTYRRGYYAAGAGGLMLCEPGELHATKRIYGAGGTFRVLSVQPETMEHLAADVGVGSVPPHLACAVSERRDLFVSFVRFHAAVESGATALEQESRLVGCLRRLLEFCAERPSPSATTAPPRAVANARDLINDAYRENIRLDDLARAAGTSRSHLCRAFAAEVGLPPHAYQLAVKVERARTLLGRGMAPASVAFDTGFCDQSHLTRHFRNALGVTPSRYAEEVGAARSPRRRASNNNVQDRVARPV